MEPCFYADQSYRIYILYAKAAPVIQKTLIYVPYVIRNDMHDLLCLYWYLQLQLHVYFCRTLILYISTHFINVHNNIAQSWLLCTCIHVHVGPILTNVHTIFILMPLARRGSFTRSSSETTSKPSREYLRQGPFWLWKWLNSSHSFTRLLTCSLQLSFC